MSSNSSQTGPSEIFSVTSDATSDTHASSNHHAAPEGSYPSTETSTDGEAAGYPNETSNTQNQVYPNTPLYPNEPATTWYSEWPYPPVPTINQVPTYSESYYMAQVGSWQDSAQPQYSGTDLGTFDSATDLGAGITQPGSGSEFPHPYYAQYTYSSEDARYANVESNSDGSVPCTGNAGNGENEDN